MQRFSADAFFVFVLKKFISVQDIHIEYINQSVLHITFMSRTDGTSWSHFLRALLTDTIQ
jgi:hypothetical protein